MRRAAKIDATQTAIVEALRRCGVHVECIGKPVDLLASHRGVWHVLEVKSAKNVHNHAGEGLTADQVKFIERSQAEVHIVRTPMEALRAVLGPEHVTMIGDIPASNLPF
jgi:hypothetical protein